MKWLRVLPLFALSVVAGTAHAWNATGHMVIAEIALQSLSESVKAECERLARIDATDKAGDFVTCSAWADDIRPAEPNTGSWHFINFHFRSDGMPLTTTRESTNIVFAIDQQSRVLRNRYASDKERARALKFLVHFVGDIHQPLHTSARDSAAHPTGDRGGNDFQLGGKNNLHGFWDRGAGLFPPLDRPLTSLAQQLVEVQASTLIATVPKPSEAVLAKPPQAWAEEGFALAKQFVYDTPENKAPNEAYVRQAQAYSARKATIAGYRLACLLNGLLSKPKA